MIEILVAVLGAVVGFNAALALWAWQLTKKAAVLTETLEQDWKLRQISDRAQAKVPDGYGYHDITGGIPYNIAPSIHPTWAGPTTPGSTTFV